MSLYERVVLLTEDAMPENAVDIFRSRVPGSLKKHYGIEIRPIDPNKVALSKDRTLATLFLKGKDGRPYSLSVRSKGSHWTVTLKSKGQTLLQGDGPKAFTALWSMKEPKKAHALKQLTAPQPKLKQDDDEPVVGIYKGKKYRVTGFKHGGNVVELAWFSDPTKSFKVATKKVKIADLHGPAVQKLMPKPPPGQVGYYRFSTTLVKGSPLKDRAVDVVKAEGPEGKNIGGAKRTQRTGGWRDRILQKFTQLSGVKTQLFGDKKDKLQRWPTMADWEAIKQKIEAATGVKKAYFMVPKKWHQTALIVEV